MIISTHIFGLNFIAENADEFRQVFEMSRHLGRQNHVDDNASGELVHVAIEIFKDIDFIVGQGQSEGGGRMVWLENANVIVKKCKRIIRVA